MSKVIHILGNGDHATTFKFEERKGTLLLCNMPPFDVPADKVYATCMVDFKMMAALTEGSLNLDMYRWVLGTRPKIWMNDPKRSQFYLKYAQNVREFYTNVPPYAKNATNFNCGHMATHYAAYRHKPDEIHLYGFDTLFDFNMRSVTDLYLSSDRGQVNNYRLINNWRPIWDSIFEEYDGKVKFVLHHSHDQLKVKKRDNIEIKTYDMKEAKKRMKLKSREKSSKLNPELTPEQMQKLNRQQRRAYEAQRRKGVL